MRLQPIEKPQGLAMRFAYWGMKRQFGRVMTPVKVLGARMPGSGKFSYALSKFELTGIGLEPELHFLLGTLVSEVNGCAFCTDLGRAMAVRRGIELAKFDALGQWRTSPLFTERERAAFAYAEEATRNRRVSDETFGRLREQFNDKEIAEITWINAVENYYNLINIPLEIGSDGLCALANPGLR